MSAHINVIDESTGSQDISVKFKVFFAHMNGERTYRIIGREEYKILKMLGNDPLNARNNLRIGAKLNGKVQ